MVHKSKTLHNLGGFLFAIGIFLGIVLILVKAWPDTEANFYGFIKDSYHRLQSLHCPVLMTSLDRQPVTVRLNNPLDRDLTWFIRVELSTPVRIITQEQRVIVPPHEHQVLAWEVDKNNVDLHNFIFVYAFASPFAGLGMTEGTCGTLVLNLPVRNGPAIYYGTLSFAGLFTLIGFWLWRRHADLSEPSVASQSWWMLFLTLMIVLGLVCSLLSLWFFAILFLVVTILTLIVALIKEA